LFLERLPHLRGFFLVHVLPDRQVLAGVTMIGQAQNASLSGKELRCSFHLLCKFFGAALVPVEQIIGPQAFFVRIGENSAPVADWTSHFRSAVLDGGVEI
jgi:hypothetical protein